MKSTTRLAVEQQEKAKGVLRGLYLGQLADIGHERSAALRRADEQLDRLARLLPSALEAGIGLAEISRAVDVSRPTLYQLRARYSDNPGDVRLAVLQETIGGTSVGSIVDAVKRPRNQIEQVLADLEEHGWIRKPTPDDYDYLDDDPGDWLMTVEGLAALEAWEPDFYGSDGAE